jgi:alpha-D-xyloside xylohydrolase
MFGDSLLVNPVTTEGARQRTVYLPSDNDWIDFWTGTRSGGGHSIKANAPLDRIPIYVKAGSIIPFGPHAESASARPDPIELRIYRGAPSSFTLYEDEGDNYDYEHGAYSQIPIHWDDKSGVLTIGNRRGRFPSMIEHRTFNIVIVTEGRGTGIVASSEPDAMIEYTGKTTSVRVRSRPCLDAWLV